MTTPTRPALALARYVEHVMGMPISLAVRGRHADDDRGRAAWDAALAVLREADRVFSTYRTDSVITRLGRGELRLADCTPTDAADITEVLALGEAARRDSGGAFAIERGGRLDPSGVVKGWAAQRASLHLAALPDTDFCLSAGGDIVCRTLDADSPPWRIGVENPHDPDRLAAVVPLHTGAVATSGSSRRGAHIVDARTGRPAAGLASVTVIGARLTAVDIDATAAFALGADGEQWISTRGHRAVLVVRADGSIGLREDRRAAPSGAGSVAMGR